MAEAAYRHRHRNRCSRCLAWLAPCLALAAAQTVPGGATSPWPWLAAGACWLALGCLSVAVCDRVAINSAGLTWRCGWRRRRFAWHEVRAIERTAALRLQNLDGAWHVVLPECPELLADIVRSSWQRRTSAQTERTAVDVAEVQIGLGLGPGERLRLGPRWWFWPIPVVLASVVVGLMGAAPNTPVQMAIVAIAAAAVAALLLVAWIRPGAHIVVCEASGDGLLLADVRRCWSIGWDEVLGVGRSAGSPCLFTMRGPAYYKPDSPRGARLDAVVENLLRQREAGRPLPRLSDVPEAALSRARVAVEVERGISRVGEGDG